MSAVSAGLKEANSILYNLIFNNLIVPISGFININNVPYGFGLMNFLFLNYLKNFQDIMPSSLYQAAATLMLVPLLVIFFLPLLLLGLTAVACFPKIQDDDFQCYHAPILGNWHRIVDFRITPQRYPTSHLRVTSASHSLICDLGLLLSKQKDSSFGRDRHHYSEYNLFWQL